MIGFLVVVYLTFMDGSISPYNDGKWEVVASQAECKEKIGKATEEMTTYFKDHDPKPSTFIQGCVRKQ